MNLNIYVCICPVLYVDRIKSVGRNCQPPCLYGNFCIAVFHAKNREIKRFWLLRAALYSWQIIQATLSVKLLFSTAMWHHDESILHNGAVSLPTFSVHRQQLRLHTRPARQRHSALRSACPAIPYPPVPFNTHTMRLIIRRGRAVGWVLAVGQTDLLHSQHSWALESWIW